MTYKFRLDPVAKPRMTRRDAWAKRPAVLKYYNFKDELRLMAKRKGYVMRNVLTVYFYIPMPKSWSKRKKEEYDLTPHKQTPDLDNLLKAFQDALEDDDSYVYCYRDCKKLWAKEGKIVVIE